MAVATGDSDLRRLERDAETARARLHETIAEIRDPRTIDNAKLEMKHRATEIKDRALGYVRERRDEAMDGGRSQVSDFTMRLQRTAIENPLPVLMIGAGIGWHLWKKPPITSALIGAGVWQLMKNWDRTPDTSAYRAPYDRTMPRGYVPGGVAGMSDQEVTDIPSAVEAAKVGATDLSYRAEDAVSGVADAFTQAKEAASSRVQDVAEAVQSRMQPVLDRAAPLFERATPWLDAQGRSQLGTMAVLAGAGILAGGLLRNSETGRRMFEEARLQADRGLNRMRDMTSSMRSAVETRMEAGMSRDGGRLPQHDHPAQVWGRADEWRGARSAQEMGAEHPILLSAIGLAIGAVLGGMIRQMPMDRDTLVARSESLAENIAERASQAVETVKDKVMGDEPQEKQAQRQRDHVSV